MVRWREMPEGLKSREQTLFAGKLLLEMLEEIYGIREMPVTEKGRYGKPYFPDHPGIRFNYTHTDHMTACIVGSREAGIDLERIRPFQERTARRFSAPGEWEWLLLQEDPDSAWIRLWTVKEAYLKYLGCGINREMCEIDLLEAVTQPEEGTVVMDALGCSFTSQRIRDCWMTICEEL